MDQGSRLGSKGKPVCIVFSIVNVRTKGTPKRVNIYKKPSSFFTKKLNTLLLVIRLLGIIRVEYIIIVVSLFYFAFTAKLLFNL